MRKILLILRRECSLRLRKPSFWVLTVLVPAVLAVIYFLPVVAAQRGAGCATVMVVDQTGLFDGGLRSTDELRFHSMPSLEYARREAGRRDLILFIPSRETTIPRDAFLYYQGESPSPALQNAVSHQLQTLLQNAILEDVYQVEPSVFHSVENTALRLRVQDAATGHESFFHVKSVVALVLAVLMALALLLFGNEVMRGVQEERQNRTAEVLLTSVRPVQLLVGKVAGVALVAVLQLVLWVLLFAFCIKCIQASAPELFAAARIQQEQHTLATKGVEATAQYTSTVQLVDETVQGLTAIRMPLVAIVFMLYFLLGYHFYGSLLAALAARLDTDAGAMQWSFLVESPLIVALILGSFIIRAPSGALATGLTLVPFTAPVAVMLRLPFGMALWQVAVSVVMLMVFFAFAARLAARSYHP